MTDAVSANTDDLGHFVTNGERYQAALHDIFETLRRRRATVATAVGHEPHVDVKSPFEELLAEATVNNRFVDTIRVALNTHEFAGTIKTAPAAQITAALEVAGLNLGGEDLSLAADQMLADADVEGPAGDDALRLLAGWMEAESIPLLSNGALLTLGRNGNYVDDDGQRVEPPREVRQAIAYLQNNPEVADTASRYVDAWDAFPAGLSKDGLETTLAVNHAVRILADRQIFRALDLDGDSRISFDEVLASEGSVDPAVFTALQALTREGDSSPGLLGLNIPFIELAGEANRQGAEDDKVTRSIGDVVSYRDVVGAAVDRRVFVHDPDAAYRFVTQLPTSFDDLSGKESGFDIRLVDDGALRALAGASLAGADGLLEQTLVVAHLPESEGGVRNLLITAYYAELGQRLNERLNDGLGDPLDPSQPGHSGANWLMIAPNASNGIRPVITSSLTAFGVLGPSSGDRQAGADGNQYIFGTIGPATAAFLEAFPAGRPVTASAMRRFLNESTFPGSEELSVFRPGQADLRDGFAYYAAALAEDDPTRRQDLVFTGNLLLATSEQGGAQNWIEEITDLDRQDDGWRFLAQPLAAVGGGDEAIATSQMTLPLGIPTDRAGDDAELFRLSHDIPNRPGLNNRLIGRPIADFDPTDPSKQVVDFGAFTVGLDGANGDVTTSRLQGWDAPPEGSNMDPLPTSVAHWAEEGDTAYLAAAGGVIFEQSGSDDGNDLRGTGAIRWSDWEERQWHIANLFHQFHTDPSLFANLADFNPRRTDISGAEALPQFVPANAIYELDGGGQR